MATHNVAKNLVLKISIPVLILSEFLFQQIDSSFSQIILFRLIDCVVLRLCLYLKLYLYE